MITDFFTWLGQQPPGVGTFVGTMAGSTLGFLALMAGALFNSYLNRRRDDRIRYQDKKAVAAALYAELNRMHHVLVRGSESLSNIPEDEVSFLIRGLVVLIYPKLIEKLGLLRAEVIREVTHAYLIVDRHKEDLLLLPGAKQTPYGIELSVDLAQDVANLGNTAAAAISDALHLLMPYLEDSEITASNTNSADKASR